MTLTRRGAALTLASLATSAAVAFVDEAVTGISLGYVNLIPLLVVQRNAGRRFATAFAVLAVAGTFVVEHPAAPLNSRIASAVLQLAIFLLTIGLYAIVQRRDARLHEALERESAERDFRFLVEAGDALTELDEQRIAMRVADLAVPTLGDACVVYRSRGDTVVAEAFAAIDDERRARLRELHRRYPYHARRPAVASARERASYVAQVDEAFIRGHALDDDHERLFREVGIRSLVSVPLVARDRVLGAISLLTFEGRRSFDHADVALIELYARRAALAIENAELYQREHRVASEYQRASLPVTLPRRESLRFAAVYEAGRVEAQVGGDWYDAFELDDGRIVISIGDVAGAGLTAAVTMAAVRQTIRGAARILADPVAILDAADATVRGLSGDRFATAFVAVLDPLDRSVEFGAAGHLTPFVRFPDGTVDRLRAGGLPLGLREYDAENVALLGEIAAGSLLVFFTDGIVETTRDVLAGLATLRATLKSPAIAAATYPAVAIRDALLPEAAEDDVAILTVVVDEAEVTRWRFPADDALGAQAAKRDFVRRLIDAGAALDEAALAEIVFGELCGNVARHAGGEVEAMLDLATPRPVLHVLDRGPGFVYTAMLQPADVFAESGRGLFIAARLARGLSVTRRPGGGSHARAVLAVVARATSAPSPSAQRAGTTVS